MKHKPLILTSLLLDGKTIVPGTMTLGAPRTSGFEDNRQIKKQRFAQQGTRVYLYSADPPGDRAENRGPGRSQNDRLCGTRLGRSGYGVRQSDPV